MRIPEVQQRQRDRMRKYTDEELISLLLAQADRLGRTPTYREVVPNADTYRVRFGSWTNAVLIAGLSPNQAVPRQYLERNRASTPLSLRYKVLQRDGFRCQYCGGTPQEGYVLHVDHRVPCSKGGRTEEANLVAACSLCNAGKSDEAPG
jgi:5-methylcytosine-specific restriction endonuclease McrA